MPQDVTDNPYIDFKLSPGSGSFTSDNGSMQDWHGFFQNVPNNRVISGIEAFTSAINTEIFGSGINVEISWDGGKTYTSTEKIKIWSDSDDAVHKFGGQDDTWGREWDVSELEDSNFRLRLEKIGHEWSTINVDDIAIQIHFEETR